MSHLVTIDVEITDLQAVADAAAAKGWVFDAEATSYKGWYGEEPCKGKISIPGEHREMEIGFVQAANGSLVPGYDDLTRDPVTEEYLSEANGLCGFLQEYQAAVTRRGLKKKGLRFTEKREAGNIKFQVQA